MNSLFLIVYKLTSTDETKLADVFKTAAGWWRYLNGSWIIASSLPMEAWKTRIRAVLSDADSYMIVNITGCPRGGWLPAKAWEWLQNHERGGRPEEG